MKKIYFTLGLGVLFLGANAQQTIKIKNPLKVGFSKENSVKRVNKKNNVNARLGGNNSISVISGNISCSTGYIAGTTMDLQINVNLASDSAFEFSDSLALTFPAGITPNSSPQTVFPSNPNYNGGAWDLTNGQMPDTLNPVSGQTISWGKNDNMQYGGIEIGAPNGASILTVTVNVTIGSGVTGNQTANFFASSDQYTAGAPYVPADYSGTFIIYPAGPDLATTFVQPKNLTSLVNCNYGSDTIVAQIKNTGVTTVVNPMVMGNVNGGTATMGILLPAGTATLAPGDSAYVAWLPAYNFSASNTYVLKAWTSLSGDNISSNDTASLSFSNRQSINLSTTSYSNGIETTQEVADLSIQGSAAPYTGLSTSVFYSGAQALFTTVPSTVTPAGTYSVAISLPCMDVTSGETYRISYWRRTNSTGGGNGQSSVWSGTNVNSLTQLNAWTTNTLGTWTKDSVDFTATATETRYFAIAGQGTVSAAPAAQMNCRFDNINITKINTSGIKSIANNSAVSIYPNPTNGILNIATTAAKAFVEIYNVMGQLVMTKEIASGTTSLDINGLSNGVYSVQVTQNNTISTSKIIKTN